MCIKFCGIDGFHIASEIDQQCREICIQNHHIMPYGNIKHITPRECARLHNSVME